VNSLSFDKSDDNKLISTSYDGTVRVFDLQAQV
jgi:WD40 repeat protein